MKNLLSVFIVYSVLLRGDFGYRLNVGNAVDVFANYGDLSQMMQVISADFVDEDESQEPTELFREKNIRIFSKMSSIETLSNSSANTHNLTIELCETFEDLLATYYKNFEIEGTTRPWKAFMGDWMSDEILRTLGVESEANNGCCFVLIKLTKNGKKVQLNQNTSATIKPNIVKAVNKLNIDKEIDVRHFMKSYGTHYIDSYATGNFIYQVFKYKRPGYNLLKSYMKSRNTGRAVSDNLRFFFSSHFLKQVGDIRVASGNKTVESWARRNLRDSQYMNSKPSLLRLYYNPVLAYNFDKLLDDGALLGLTLKTLRPIFKDRYKSDRFAEIVENDLKLWEINS